MSAERALAETRFECQQLDRLLSSYSELLDAIELEDPALVELTAVASVLHSFYNGLENIFVSIAKWPLRRCRSLLRRHFCGGDDWHLRGPSPGS